jgi:hypothetical protein
VRLGLALCVRSPDAAASSSLTTPAPPVPAKQTDPTGIKFWAQYKERIYVDKTAPCSPRDAADGARAAAPPQAGQSAVTTSDVAAELAPTPAVPFAGDQAEVTTYEATSEVAPVISADELAATAEVATEAAEFFADEQADVTISEFTADDAPPGSAGEHDPGTSVGVEAHVASSRSAGEQAPATTSDIAVEVAPTQVVPFAGDQAEVTTAEATSEVAPFISADELAATADVATDAAESSADDQADVTMSEFTADDAPPGSAGEHDPGTSVGVEAHVASSRSAGEEAPATTSDIAVEVAPAPEVMPADVTAGAAPPRSTGDMAKVATADVATDAAPLRSADEHATAMTFDVAAHTDPSAPAAAPTIATTATDDADAAPLPAADWPPSGTTAAADVEAAPAGSAPDTPASATMPGLVADAAYCTPIVKNAEISSVQADGEVKIEVMVTPDTATVQIAPTSAVLSDDEVNIENELRDMLDVIDSIEPTDELTNIDEHMDVHRFLASLHQVCKMQPANDDTADDMSIGGLSDFVSDIAADVEPTSAAPELRANTTDEPGPACQVHRGGCRCGHGSAIIGIPDLFVGPLVFVGRRAPALSGTLTKVPVARWQTKPNIPNAPSQTKPNNHKVPVPNFGGFYLFANPVFYRVYQKTTSGFSYPVCR